MELNFATTTLPTILLWVIGLALFTIGGFIGYLNFNMDARKKIESADATVEAARVEADRKIKEAEKKLEEAKQFESQVSASASLLRLHQKDNRVIVEMDGKSLSGLLAVDEKKRLLEIISHVRPFIEGANVQPAPIKPVMTQTPQNAPLPVPPVVTEIKPVPASILPSAKPKKLDPEKEFALLSIVQQIDSVLQMRLLGTPFEGQGIRLQESLEGAVEVYVGLQKYEAIDDVKDETIKKIIRAAISEWETKYAPGNK
jgi:hypothetical protein